MTLPVSSRSRLSTTVLVSGVAVISLTVVLIGRLPVRGSIAVSQSHSDRLAEIMKQNGVLFWTGIGGLGMMDVQFDNPLALAAVDDLILEDARKNKYTAVIRYECILPFFNHKVTVN